MTAPNWANRTMRQTEPDQPAVRATVYPILSAPANSSWTGEQPGQTTLCKKGRCNEFAYLKRIGTPCQVSALRAVIRTTLPRTIQKTDERSF